MKNSENLENSNKFKNKISYVFKRTFVGIGKAPLIKIGLLQVVIMFAFAFFVVFFARYLSTPKQNNIENLNFISGKYVSYERIDEYKNKYCIFGIISENNQISKIKSTLCPDKLYNYPPNLLKNGTGEIELIPYDIKIWHSKDLLKIDRIYPYQIILHNNLSNSDIYILEFDNKEKYLLLKLSFLCLGILIVCYILIYVFNTDEVQEKFEQKLKKKELDNKKLTLKSKLNFINLRNKEK